MGQFLRGHFIAWHMELLERTITLEQRRKLRRHLLLAVLYIAIWSVIGAADGIHSYYLYAYRGDPLTWGQSLAMEMSLWYAWAILFLFVFQITRRTPFEVRNWPRRLALFTAAGFVFALVKIAMDYPIIKLFYCPTPHLLTWAKFYQMGFREKLYDYLLIYWFLVGISHGVIYFQRSRERELRATILEMRLAQAKLQILRMQLHPHFLFNALNTISALMHSDLDKADRALARLGDLLRILLDHTGVQEVTFKEELDFIEAYLEIEKMRFGSGLRVRIQVDHRLLDTLVPHLLLQPLVENALRHGIALRSHSGQIDIRAERVQSRLRVEVLDDGPGLTEKQTSPHKGLGLVNTRARLQELYGEAYRLELGPRPTGGVAVTVEIPLKKAPESGGRSQEIVKPSQHKSEAI